MANLTHVRLCAFGGEDAMRLLCLRLLLNYPLLDMDKEKLKDMTMDQLLATIHEQAKLEDCREDGFLYSMVCTGAYGDVLDDTCRLTIERYPAGLWLAGFSYDSKNAFQPEDWQRLHVQCGGLPMAALYANDDFNLPKGMKIILGGRVHDNWNYMGEVWLWLVTQYMSELSPAEAVARLRKLRKHIDEEEYDMTIGETLNAALSVLEGLAEDNADPEALRNEMLQYREESDYESLFALQSRIAEMFLWDVANAEKWLAALEAVKDAWVDAEGEDA
jgi:hypothetical protein